jgi:hypothetical protein
MQSLGQISSRERYKTYAMLRSSILRFVVPCAWALRSGRKAYTTPALDILWRLGDLMRGMRFGPFPSPHVSDCYSDFGEKLSPSGPSRLGVAQGDRVPPVTTAQSSIAASQGEREGGRMARMTTHLFAMLCRATLA